MNHQQDRVAFARQYLSNLCEVVRQVPLAALAQAMELLEQAFEHQRQIFLAGNGGSASTASHMANDLMKGVAKSRSRGCRAIALTDNVALLTAIGNDESYTEVFAGQLAALGQSGDVLVVCSASGNSPNILRALEVARERQLTTVAFLGMGGGRAARMADVAVIVPSNEYGPVEDLHLVFDHLITAFLRSVVPAAQQR